MTEKRPHEIHLSDSRNFSIPVFEYEFLRRYDRQSRAQIRAFYISDVHTENSDFLHVALVYMQTFEIAHPLCEAVPIFVSCVLLTCPKAQVSRN